MGLPKPRYNMKYALYSMYYQYVEYNGGMNRIIRNHFRIFKIIEFYENNVAIRAKQILARLGVEYQKKERLPSDYEIISRMLSLDAHIHVLFSTIKRAATMEKLVNENYDFRGKYNNLMTSGSIPRDITLKQVEEYLDQTHSDRPFDKYTMEAYTRHMKGELAKVVQNHIRETIAQGIVMNWNSGKTIRELSAKLKAEQEKQTDESAKDAFPNIETVVRTESSKIMGAETWKAATTMENGEEDTNLWGFTYNAVGDSRTRSKHMLQDGCSAPKDDPFWQVWAPPNGYNCRCWINAEFFEPENIKEPHREVMPDLHFAFNPGKVLQ